MKKLLSTLIAILFVSPAWCSLIEVDIYNDGSNSGFRDSSSSLVWMDFGQTQNLSVNQVLAMTQTGGIYEGWRLPEEMEVVQLWQAIIGNNYTRSFDSSSYNLNEVIGSPILSYWYLLAEIMGTTSSGVTPDSGVEWFSSIGIYESDDGLLVASRLSTYQMYQGYVEGVLIPVETHEVVCSPTDTACTPRDYWNEQLSFTSTMLVREVEVSEPLSIALFGFALLFVSRNIRRKSIQMAA